jgi:N-acetylglucosamine malate deacetylase 1
LTTLLELGKEQVLIIAPHSDDEVLGCGGLIEKACRLQNKVKVVIGAIGTTKFRHSGETVLPRTREEEFVSAIEELGCSNFEILYKDKEAIMDTIPQKEIVTKIDHLIDSFNPSMVFIPYPSFHQDHQALFRACMAALRPSPGRHYKLIAMYEYPFIVWQYPKLNDVGELYLDISKTIDKKIDAFKKHQSQIRDSAHIISPEKVKEWAKMRGLEFGVEYAEKYHILRAELN